VIDRWKHSGFIDRKINGNTQTKTTNKTSSLCSYFETTQQSSAGSLWQILQKYKKYS
jgi:hypothetical protein